MAKTNDAAVPAVPNHGEFNPLDCHEFKGRSPLLVDAIFRNGAARGYEVAQGRDEAGDGRYYVEVYGCTREVFSEILKAASASIAV